MSFAINDIATCPATHEPQTDTTTEQTVQPLADCPEPAVKKQEPRRRFDAWNVLGVSVLALSLWLAWQPAAETSISSAATAESSIADLAGSSFAPAQKPIIEIAVGDAVRTDTARGDHDTSLGTQVDPLTWKHLVLKCRKVDGSTAEVGGTIEVSVPECGIEGQANVLAGDLKVGEHLLGDTGRVEITAISPRGPPEPVYNLEVLGDHNYKVTQSSLLVHNSNDCTARFIYYPKSRRYHDTKTGRFIAQKHLPYPQPNGFSSSQQGIVPKGTVIDRYGRLNGRFAGSPGDSVSQR